MTFYLTQAFYQHYTGFSGTSLYEPWSLSMFNTLFTSLPVIFLGIFEQDLLPATLIAVPELYTKGQRSGGFNVRIDAGWTFMAATEAVTIFFTAKALWGEFAGLAGDQGVYAMGNACFTAVVALIATKLLVLEMHNLTYMNAIGWLLSLGAWFLWNLILSQTYGENGLYNVRDGFTLRFGRMLLWWLVVVLLVSVCVVFELGVRALKAALWPTDEEIFRSCEKDAALRQRFELASRMWLQPGWEGRASSWLGRRLGRTELVDAPPAGVVEEEDAGRREAEVRDLLSRPRSSSSNTGGDGEGVTDNNKASVQTDERPILLRQGSTSMNVKEALARRFGRVKVDTP